MRTREIHYFNHLGGFALVRGHTNLGFTCLRIDTTGFYGPRLLYSHRRHSFEFDGTRRTNLTKP